MGEANPERSRVARRGRILSIDLPTAELDDRAFALVVDLVVVFVASVPLADAILARLGATELGLRKEAVLLTLGALYVAYFVLFEVSPLRATPGKLAFGLKVVDRQGERIGWARA